MFRNMKLSTKMALGFGALVVIAAVLGIVGWRGSVNVATVVEADAQGNAALITLSDCAAHRRDFAKNGFRKAEGDDRTAAEKWQDSYDQFTAQLRELSTLDALQAADRALLAQMEKHTTTYEQVFRKQEEAQRSKDEGFARWGQVGWDLTSDIQKEIDETITPALQGARDSGQLEEYDRWSSWQASLYTDMYQRFLVLRVTAVYLLATDREEQWEAYQKQLAQTRAGLESWQKRIAGQPALVDLAGRIDAYLSEYEAAGAQYYDGVLASRAADTEMAAAASGITSSMDKLSEALEAEMASDTARTEMTMLVGALAAVVIGSLLAVVITRSIVGARQSCDRRFE